LTSNGPLTTPRDHLSQLCHFASISIAFLRLGSEMSRLAEIRNQEMVCRERALLDTDRRAFWLAKADEWAKRAVDEITLQFEESNGRSFTAAEAK
jgi:hypothetical protein